MPYLSIDDQAADHPKIEALSDKAFRLWFKGITYCQRFLTDGHIAADVVRGLRGWSKVTQDELAKVLPPFTGPLWHVAEDGSVRVHDFLNWNDSRAEVLKRRTTKTDRMKAWREKKDGPQTTPQARPRDGLQDAPQDGLRATAHNHNHSVAKATHPAAPLVGKRNTRVLNEADPVQFPAFLREEFQTIIGPRVPAGTEPYDALLAWVHEVSDRTIAEYGSAPKALLTDTFTWWRAKLAEDWGADEKPKKVKICSRHHTPPCADEAACSALYRAELDRERQAMNTRVGA